MFFSGKIVLLLGHSKKVLSVQEVEKLGSGEIGAWGSSVAPVDDCTC